MKNLKRKFSLLLVLMLALACMLPAAQANTLNINQAAVNQLQQVVTAGTKSGTDIVVLIDRSGTMKTNDPDNLALSATTELANLLRTTNNQSGGINIAVIAYGYGVVSATNGFVDISDDASLAYLENTVTNEAVTKVVGSEDTNTGFALQQAYQMIQDRKAQFPSNSFAVVLLSDGKVDVGDSDGFFAAHPDLSKKNKGAQAYLDVKQAEIKTSRDTGANIASQLAAEGIPLHCVGIYKDSEAELGDDMKAWVAGTNGQYVTLQKDEADQVKTEVAKIVTAINQQIAVNSFILRSGEPAYFEVEPGTVQVNLSVSPAFDSQYCKISHETAGDVTHKCNFVAKQNAKGEAYTIVEMVGPTAGKYSITISDGQEHIFDVTMVSIKGLSMVIDPLPSVANGDPVTIRMDVTKDGAFYMDNTNLPLVTVKKADGSVHLNDTPMQLTQDANGIWAYTLDYLTDLAGDFVVSAKMSKDSIYNYSNEVPLHVEIAPIRWAADPQPYTFEGHAITWTDANGSHQGYENLPYELSYADLGSKYFDNRDNRQIARYEYTVSDPSAINIVDDGSKFIITPVRAATGVEIRFVAVDANGIKSDPSKPVVQQINIVDAQAPVQIDTLGNEVNGRSLKERTIVGSFIEDKEAVAVVTATETQAEVILDDVTKLFVEPNMATDGEPIREITVAVYEDNTDIVSEGVQASVVNNQLMVKGVEAGQFDLVVTAASYDNSTASVLLNLEVKDSFMMWALIIGGILALIILVIIIIIVAANAAKPSFGSGILNVTLNFDDDISDGTIMLKKYGKKAVDLVTLCRAAGIHTGAARKTLEKIKIKPRKKGLIEIFFNIKGLGKKNIVMRSMDSKSIELDASGTNVIEFEYDDGKGNY